MNCSAAASLEKEIPFGRENEVESLSSRAFLPGAA